MKILFSFLIPVLFFSAPVYSQEPAPSVSSLIEEGDHHWDLRDEGAQGTTADSKEVDLAISAYRQALASLPDSLAARWRLMRGLFFKGEYATEDNEAKKKIFDEGKAVGEKALQLVRQEATRRAGKPFDKAGPVEMAPVFGNSPDVVGCFFWSSANWGMWALSYGKFQAVRQGAAGKIRDLATAVTMMDPEYGQGGGYRVLGRLHHQTPYVPFITGWASTKKAVAFLRKAYQIEPRNSANRLYLAEALWDWNNDSRKEALTLAEDLIHDAPRSDFRVEDQAAQEKAQALLEKWRGKN
jgi:tetratricopeptide (TPR) repeat protein